MHIKWQTSAIAQRGPVEDRNGNNLGKPAELSEEMSVFLGESEIDCFVIRAF